MAETISIPDVSTILVDIIKRLTLVEGRLLNRKAPFKLPKLTTTERDALDAVNGDMIYNTTTNRVEAYENGSWADL